MRCTLSPFLLLTLTDLLVLAGAGGRDGNWFNPRALSAKAMSRAAILALRRPNLRALLPRVQAQPPLVLTDPSPPQLGLPPLHAEPSPAELELPPLQINAFPLQPDLPPVIVRCEYDYGYDSSIATPPDMVLSAAIHITGLSDANDHARAFRQEIEGRCNATNLATYEPRETLERGTLTVQLQIIIALEGEGSTSFRCVDNAVRDFSGSPDLRNIGF